MQQRLVEVGFSGLSSRACSAEEVEEKLQRPFKHLQGTLGYGMVLEFARVGIGCWIDAWYGVDDDRGSHSEVLSSLGMEKLLAQSAKQNLVAESSAELELVGYSGNCGSACWTQSWVRAQRYENVDTVVHHGSTSTSAKALKRRSNSVRAEHIDLGCFWRKNHAARGVMKMVCCLTAETVVQGG
jgi:hypothetical protein